MKPITGHGRPGVRRALIGLAIMAGGLVSGLPQIQARAAGPCGPPVVNPVACENTNLGTPQSQWDISGAGDSTIQGFATDISVNKGATVSFKINTSASSYTITIYRLGYYQGNGARQIATVSPSAPLPQTQPACLTNAPTGLIDCGNWAVSASWPVPSTAVSGVYFAKLVRPDTGGASFIMFVVRDDASHSAVLFQTDDTTWQAYNDYGGNSVYLGTAPSSDGRAYKVSYNRPFHTRSEDPGYGTSNFVFYAEYPMIRFLEQNGYDLSYATKVDADRSGALIKNHKVLLTSGHDEYWSAGERAAAEAARDAGVNLAFFSGNETFWKIRWENSIDGSGTPYRTLVTYKETKSPTPIDPQDPPTWTGSWRDPTWSPPADGGRPENALTGTIFMVNRGSAAITVPSTYSSLRFWRNTSVASLGSGQTATLGTQTLGYEWDEDLDNGARPAGLIDLSSTTVSVPELLQDYGNTYSPGTAVHHLTLYRAPSGALVFGAGTVQWAWGLDVAHDTFPDTGPTTPDVAMQQATVNLLADMGAQPTTIMSGLVATAASTDTLAPASAITFPANGATLTPRNPLTISGTAADNGGGVVAGVEISLDGGSTWHPATGTTNWTYAWTPVRPGSVTIRSRATDDSGNLEKPGPGVTVTVPGSAGPAFVSESGVTNGQTVPGPSNIAAGDLLLGIMEVDSDPATVTGPAGWTRVLDTAVSAGGSRFHAQVWDKVAGSNEPSSYSWSVSGNPWVDIGVLDYAFANSTTPIDAIAGRDAGTTASPVTASITTTQANDTLVASFINYETVDWAAGSGMAQRYSFDGNTAQDSLQAGAGTSGTKTATAGGVGPTAAIILALKPASSDTTPPTVAMTAPANGSTVSGSIPVSASASDNVGVASVQFQLDGANLGAAVTTAPYTVSWNTALVGNGSHTLKAIATDSSGNQATSSPVGVTVSNVPPQISNVTSSGITTTAATIGWTTDVAASSQADYGTTTAYGSSTTLDSSLVTSHSQAIGGLQPATTYHYRVKSANAGGVLATSGDFTFTTATPAPPQISNVTLSNVTSSAATISWATDTPSDTTVRYGADTSYGSTASTPGRVTSHSQTLTTLSPNSTYHYQVQSTDAYGQLSSSGDFAFTTPGPPPTISNVVVSNITTAAATVGWTTDVVGTSQVDYGTTLAYGSSTTLDTSLVTSHSQALSGLSPGTTYHYRVKSANASGSLALSGDFVFTTATPPPPVVSNVQAGSISSSTATITWTTDVASDSTVQYGTTTAYGSTASTATLTTNHSQALSGLASNTTYHYRVLSKDAYGQVTASSDFTLTTLTATTPPSFRSASAKVNGTTVTKPTGVVAGDLLLAQLEVDADPVTVTGPSGWTLLLDTPAAQGTASAFHAQVWYKVATASEPASYSWTVPGGPWVDIGLVDYSNVNSTTPIDASNGRYVGIATAATTNAVTTTSANDLVVAIFIDYNTASWTAGSSMTRRVNSDGNEVQDLAQAAAGSTGAKAATASLSGPITAQIITLRAK